MDALRRFEVLATAPARLWSQSEQPSRYAEEPGELEFVALSLWGDKWKENVHKITNNNAIFGIFQTPGGGTVVNVGVTDWVCALGERTDPDIAKITDNILRRLGNQNERTASRDDVFGMIQSKIPHENNLT